MIFLETARLTLRNFCPEDAAPLLEYATQYRASPMGIYDYEWTTRPEEIQEIVRTFEKTDSFMAVCLKETGQYIGFVDLMKSDQAEDSLEFDLGYGFIFAFHGRGFASEASAAVVRYAFEQLGARRLTSGTAQANLASQRVLQKLGYVKTHEEQVSFQKDAEGNPIIFTGYGYELTRHQWENKT